MGVGVGLSQHTTELDPIGFGTCVLGEGTVRVACVGLVNAVNLQEVIGTLLVTAKFVYVEAVAIQLDSGCGVRWNLWTGYTTTIL